MVRASIDEAVNNLSALLDRVKGGETVLITDVGGPVAQITPVAGENQGGQESGSKDEARLTALERAGLIRRGQGSLSWVLHELPPGPVGGSGVLDALLRERREGR